MMMNGPSSVTCFLRLLVHRLALGGVCKPRAPPPSSSRWADVSEWDRWLRHASGCDLASSEVIVVMRREGVGVAVRVQIVRVSNSTPPSGACGSIEAGHLFHVRR